jgi:hypothetical protein
MFFFGMLGTFGTLLLGACVKIFTIGVMSMMKKRETVKDGVKALGEKRKKIIEMEKAWKKEGWGYLRKNEVLYKPSEDNVCSNYPMHGVSSSDSKYNILRKILPHDFLLGTLRRRVEDREGGLTFDKGRGKVHEVKECIFTVLYILAVRIWIHGMQQWDLTREKAVRGAVHDLNETNKKIYCPGTMRRLLAMFWFEVDTIDEFQISENLGKLFSTFGDAVSGDEKLFHYTGASGYVHLVVSKPGRLGLWMFQLAVSLACGLPCLVYTKMHESCMENGRTFLCTDTVKDWGNMIVDRLQCKETTLYMDSYYLTHEGRKWLKAKRVQYIASLNRGQFVTIVSMLDRKIDKSGTFVMAHNNKTKESAVFSWSTNKRLGKKFVLGTGFEKKRKDAESGGIPMYDHYKMGFSHCNKFNKALHGKTWPYKLQGEQRIASDYLFTCVLINVYHLWIDAGPSGVNRKVITWKEFCTDLAREILQ